MSRPLDGARASAYRSERVIWDRQRPDLYDTAIQVLLVVPGKVSSTYFEHNLGSEERLPRITRLVPTLTPEQVAAALVRGIERDRREIVVPAMLRLVMLARALAPAVVDRFMFRTGARRTLP